MYRDFGNVDAKALALACKDGEYVVR